MQRSLAANRLDAAIDSRGVADVAGAKKVDERVASGSLSGRERRPALEEVAEDGRFSIAKPAEYLREVGLERAGDAVGESRPIFDQRASRLDEPAQRAHGGALGLKALKLFGMT